MGSPVVRMAVLALGLGGLLVDGFIPVSRFETVSHASRSLQATRPAASRAETVEMKLAQVRLKKKHSTPRVYTVEHLQELMDGKGLRLRDVDVRGDSTAALLETDLPHPVAKAIYQRLEEGSKPGNRTDGLKIALALEGGGMRGCVGAGMLAALTHLGLRDAFDVVYGSSAGSLMGAYFLTDQTPYEGPGIYYELLSGAGKQFIDKAQIMRSIGLGALNPQAQNWRDMLRGGLGKPILNLDFLLDKVVKEKMPLLWDRFWKRQQLVPLKVIASALLSKQSVALSSEAGNFATLDELTHCMRASMLLPGVAGPLVRIPLNRTGTTLGQTFWPDKEAQDLVTKASEPLCDALMFEPIPYRSALKEGATHVLVLRTRPDEVKVTGKISIIEKLNYKRFFRRKNDLPGMAEWMLEQQHKRIYAEDILLLNKEARRTDGPEPHLMTVALSSDMPEIGRLEMKREVLLEGVMNGFAIAYDLLVPDPGLRGEGKNIAKEIYLDKHPPSIVKSSPPQKKKLEQPMRDL